MQLYEKLGNLQKQYEFANKGQALNPADESWNYAKGELAVKLGKNDEAIAIADAFINKYPDSAQLYVVKGLALDAQGKVQQAIGAYSKTIALHPGNAYAYLCRAKDFANISRYQNAVKDLTTIINFGQEVDEVYNRRGQAYYNLHQMDEAQQDFTKAISLNSANAIAYANRGWIYFSKADNANALTDFQKSASINAAYVDALFGQASVYNKEKNYPQAISFIEKAIAADNRMPPYYALYSSALLSAGKDNEGLAAADKVLQLDGKNPDGFILKATAFSNLKKFGEAENTITAGIMTYPDNYLMYGVRSFIYKQQGKTALADADTEKAKMLSSKN